MKAIRANLTLFIDDASDAEPELRRRLEKLLRNELRDLKNWNLSWDEDRGRSGRVPEDLASKLDSLDT